MSVFKRSSTGVGRSRSGESSSPDRRDPGRPAALPRRGTEASLGGAAASEANVATVSSRRWLRFTEVVRKLSRLFVFIAEVLFPVPSLKAAGAPIKRREQGEPV